MQNIRGGQRGLERDQAARRNSWRDNNLRLQKRKGKLDGARLEKKDILNGNYFCGEVLSLVCTG
ncbi:hypothetical protein HanIR_Chr10g0486701 [Helianthus annuus]|nr:hypothetical protein HanIR_Chr10g0486701 [Helianthus annuus]